MKRNLILFSILLSGMICIILAGHLIVIGEKIASLTHFWWSEYLFYGIILLPLFYYVVYPFIRLYRTPQLPALQLSETEDSKELLSFGKKLADNCGYISNDNRKGVGKECVTLRKTHERELRESLSKASGDPEKLRKVISDELSLRFDGNKELGILGINKRILEWAKTVFMVSAVSQNSRFDAISVAILNLQMIRDLIHSSGFRPSNKQLLKIYVQILSTSLVTYAVSEALDSEHGMSFPDSSDASDVSGAEDIDPDSADFHSEVEDSDGLGIYSILERLKIPGIIVRSGIDGTVNALMTLRIGYVTRCYLQEGSKALSGWSNKRRVKRMAMKEAVKNIPSVIVAGGSVIGKRTAGVIKKIVKRDFSFGKSVRDYLKRIKKKLL